MPGPGGSPAPAVRAIKAVNAIGRRGSWSLEIPEAVADLPNWHVFATIPELAILPTALPIAAAMRVMNGLMASEPGEGLIVRFDEKGLGVQLGVVMCGHHERRWFVPMTLWSSDADLWIVPDPWHPAVRAECFSITSGRLREGAAPWMDKAEERAGRARAAAWMAAITG